MTKICDICGKHVGKVGYSSLIRSRENNDDKDRCKDCGINLRTESRRNNVEYENSFEYFALENNMQELLNHFSKNNKRPPSKVSKGTSDVFLWECNKCNSEYEMSLHAKLQSGVICSFCNGRKTNETNCLVTTHPELAELLMDKEKGYKLSKGSHEIEEFVCPLCGNVDTKVIYNAVKYGVKCSRCHDGISYPEKFLTKFLEQSKLLFHKEYIFEWSKNLLLDKSNKYSYRRYDFYIPSLNCVVETHGGNHYNGNFETVGGRNAEDEIENDRLKEELAKKNGIENYIVIDCRKSELEWIRNSVLKSSLINFVNVVDNIDWIECHKFACKNMVKETCDVWNECKSIDLTSKKLGISTVSVSDYLKKGTVLGWCDYDSKRGTRRPVVQLTLDGKFVKEFNSIVESANYSNTNKSKISDVCRGKRKTSGGFIWMYKEDYEKYLEEKKNYNLYKSNYNKRRS